MAFGDTNLTRELVAWVIQRRGTALICPVCGAQHTTNWTAERVTTSTPYQDPHVRYELVCQTCGYTMTFAPDIVAKRG
jgi:C4-type Zn-finger protein